MTTTSTRRTTTSAKKKPKKKTTSPRRTKATTKTTQRRSKWSRSCRTNDRGVEHGYRSGYEDDVARDLADRGVSFAFEAGKVSYVVPARDAKYTPDFFIPKQGASAAYVAPSGELFVPPNWHEDEDFCNAVIVIETKGRFVAADRQKHLLIKKQFPWIDLRFVFGKETPKGGPNAPINKGSPTTCAAWCEKHGFKWAANKRVPDEWLRETI